MLQFRFMPLSSDSTGTIPTFSGHGRLTLLLNGQDVWSDEESTEIQGVEEYWDGLLHHLAQNWLYLMTEDPYPLHFNPISPAVFLDEAMRQLREMRLSERPFIEEEGKVFSFNDRHNLAAGMPEIHLPPLFMLREGREMRIVADSMDVRLPIELVRRTLEEMGDTIARHVHSQSPRGRVILDAWNNRQQLPPRDTIYSMVTGISEKEMKALAANDDPEDLFGPPSLDAPSPMLLAARMTQHQLNTEEIRNVMIRVAKVKPEKLSKKFLSLRRKALEFIQLETNRSQKHYRQGYLLAQWLRSELNHSDDQPFEPGPWLRDCGVRIEKTKAVPREIDALARWTNDAAAIVINKKGKHAATEWGERTSLAHELAHLLVDTDHTLPSVEILGGKMPALVEKRASAFAAEILMPRSQAAAHMPQELTYHTLKELIGSLADSFKVGRVLTGMQVANLLKDEDKLTPLMSRQIKKAIGEQGENLSSSWVWFD
jgi:Zn-dependent peptidase ImmA (M78 family)